MKIDHSEFSSLIVYSFRYCLGRKSYAVGDMCTIIRRYINVTSNNELSLMLKELNQCKDFGMDCDKQEWSNVMYDITKELNERGQL